jgi:hypothetical protein
MRPSRGLRYAIPLLFFAHFLFAQSDVDRRVQQLETDLRQTRGELSETRGQLQQVLQELRELRQQIGTHAPAAAAAATPAPAGPPDYTAATPPPPGQSIVASKPAETLEDVRQNQELIAAQVEEQHQTKVESSSRYRVKLSGLILMNAFANSGSVDVPDLANRAFAPTQKTGIGATMRQTVLGVQVFGPEVAGAQTSGSLAVDFFGGTPQVPYGATAGIVRLRTGSMRFDWKNNSVVMGQEAPFFAPLSPTSFATIGEPALSWAGNLWVWTPQIVAEHRFRSTEDSWFSIQGGLLMPLTEQIPDTAQYTGIEAGQRSRRPAIGTEFSWNAKAFGQPVMIGIGAYDSHLKYELGRETESWAVTGNWRLPLSSRFEFSGEGYRGKAVGGLGGGIWQSVAYNGDPALSSTQFRPLNSIGGWSQLKYRFNPRWELNGAAGQDNVLASDVLWAGGLRGEFTPRLLSRNREAFGNVIFHPRSNLLLSAEYRHIWTWQANGASRTADHVNLAAGISF